VPAFVPLFPAGRAASAASATTFICSRKLTRGSEWRHGWPLPRGSFGGRVQGSNSESQICELLSQGAKFVYHDLLIAGQNDLTSRDDKHVIVDLLNQLRSFRI